MDPLRCTPLVHGRRPSLATGTSYYAAVCYAMTTLPISTTLWKRSAASRQQVHLISPDSSHRFISKTFIEPRALLIVLNSPLCVTRTRIVHLFEYGLSASIGGGL